MTGDEACQIAGELLGRLFEADDADPDHDFNWTDLAAALEAKGFRALPTIIGSTWDLPRGLRWPKTRPAGCELFASVRALADTRQEAEQMLRSALGPRIRQRRAWPNGDPILFEASMDGEADLIEVDGQSA